MISKTIGNFIGLTVIFVLILVFIDVLSRLEVDSQIISGVLSGGIAGVLTYFGVKLTINNQEKRERIAKEELRQQRMPRVHIGCRSMSYEEKVIKQHNRIATETLSLSQQIGLYNNPLALKVPLTIYLNNIGKTEIVRVGIALILSRGETAERIEERINTEEVWFTLRTCLERGETFAITVEDYLMAEDLTQGEDWGIESQMNTMLYQMAFDVFFEDEYGDVFQVNGMYQNNFSYDTYIVPTAAVGEMATRINEDVTHFARVDTSNVMYKNN